MNQSPLEDDSPQQMPEPPNSPEREAPALSLLDISLLLAHRRKLILVATTIVTAMGLFTAIVSPAQYTSTARLVRESTSSTAPSMGGLSALRGLGINLGGSPGGLSVDSYPNILNSWEVNLAVANSPLYFPEHANTMTLIAHFNLQKSWIKTAFKAVKKYTIGLPGVLMRWAKGDPSTMVGTISDTAQLVQHSEIEEGAIEFLKNALLVGIDNTTGIMNLKVTTNDPYLSTQLILGYIAQLRERVRAIYTQKARDNVEFIQGRFLQVQGELEFAEEKLAYFIDRNRNPQTAKLQTAMNRLKQQVTFKVQLYSDLQTQLTQAEIELQRGQPVITVIEAPVVPRLPSGPKRKFIVLISLILGMGLGAGLVWVLAVVESRSADLETKPKLDELRQLLRPANFRIRWRKPTWFRKPW